MSTATDTTRAQFEAWAKGKLSTSRFKCGHYLSPITQCAWAAWQESRRLAPAPTPKKAPQ